MKTKITAPAGDRRAFRTSQGLRTVEADQSVTVEGLELSAESRASLEGLGWVFEGDAAADHSPDAGNMIAEATDKESLTVHEPAKPAPKRSRKARG